MSKPNLKAILEPGYIGPVRTKNRILRMGATVAVFPWDDGHIPKDLIYFYGSIAKGGLGLVCVGPAPIDEIRDLIYRLDHDKYLADMQRLTEAIKKHGCPAFLQQFHVGPWHIKDPVAASALKKDEMTGDYPAIRALTIPEMKVIVEKFGDQAARAKKAGFDGIELNAGAKHLLGTFLSRAFNKREDEYGYSSMENRARLLVEILAEIKRRNGKDFPVVVLFNAAEPGLKNGMTPAEAQQLAQIFEANGADAIHAREEFYITRKATGFYDSYHFPDVSIYPEPPAYATSDIVDTSRSGEGGWTPAGAAIKKAVNIPVISVGRLNPAIGEEMIKRGEIDFININRRNMADPDYVNKFLEGRFKDIAPCTGCMTCFETAHSGTKLPRCQVNAAYGKGQAYEIKPTAKKKKVVVIGGGPAGMEAARVAALEGHQVTLFEKKNSLGGSVNLAVGVNINQRESLLDLINYLKAQIKKAGVDIRLDKEANKEVVQELKPNVIIVASGSKLNIPDIPGIDNKKVTTKYVSEGDNFVIMGGNIQGCQTAEFMVKRGKKVTIVESGPAIGKDMGEFFLGAQLLDWLNKKEMPMITDVKYEQITDEGLVITTMEEKKLTLKADKIVITHLQPNNDLFYALEDVAPEVYMIGDCAEPRLIADAIGDGSRIARTI